jgi:hypothetical protein
MAIRQQVQEMIGDDKEINPEEVPIHKMTNLILIVQQFDLRLAQNRAPKSRRQVVLRGIHKSRDACNERDDTQIDRKFP